MIFGKKLVYFRLQTCYNLNMKLFGFFTALNKQFNKQKDFNSLYADFKNESHAKLIDVRTNGEYNNTHMVRAINVPLDEINTINLSKDTKIYVYCRSGSRSAHAAEVLRDKGYNVVNMGGINSYNGFELE